MDHRLADLFTTFAQRLIQVCISALLFLIMSMNPVLSSSTYAVCNRLSLQGFSQLVMHSFLCLLICVLHKLLSSDFLATSLSSRLHHFFRRRSPILIRCRIAGGRRYRISRHACRRDATVSRLFRCNRVFASLVNTVTTLVTYVYRWFLPRAEIKRIAHAITGNISMRELQEALNKLGMNQQWHEQATKALLQDSARKQTAQELFEAGLLFDLGKLIHDTPVSSASPPQSGGKGTGKGKGKSRPSARTPWADLTPRPAAIFEDGAKNPLSVISIKVAHAAAKGVFLAGVGEFESFLDITSNSPLAMLVPQTPKVRSMLQSRGVAFAERLVALHDPNSDITTPKPVFLITLGGSVVFAEATPDAQFEAPVPTVEIAIDIEIHCIDPCMQLEVDKNARHAFKQIVHAAFSEQIVSECYSVFVRASVLQGIIKIPVSQLMNVLRRSGPDGIFAKEKWRAQPVQFPLALIHQSQLREKSWDNAANVG